MLNLQPVLQPGPLDSADTPDLLVRLIESSSIPFYKPSSVSQIAELSLDGEQQLILKEIARNLKKVNIDRKSEKNPFKLKKRKLEFWEVLDSLQNVFSKMLLQTSHNINTNSIHDTSALIESKDTDQIKYSLFGWNRRSTFKRYFQAEIAESIEYSENYQDILNSYYDVRKETTEYVHSFMENVSGMLNNRREKELGMFSAVMSPKTKALMKELHADKFVFVIANLMTKILQIPPGGNRIWI